MPVLKCADSRSCETIREGVGKAQMDVGVIKATSGHCDKMISGSIRGTWGYVSILETVGMNDWSD